jgi:hypothetical protein
MLMSLCEPPVYIACYLRDAREMIPNEGKAVSEAFRCFQEIRVKHCTDIQVGPRR